MLKIIRFSIQHKLIVILFILAIAGYGIYAITKIPLGATPDITNNQVQVITTSRNLSTEDVEKFITYPVELQMANLPGVTEIRSVSKFGLSVVTIVFEESLGTYLPRQLIAEKIKAASEAIPDNFGSPEMGPITTGLGEIYQYTLDVKPGYEDWYSPTELRTIQDWIVKRQLSGIKGVVEINSWGGFLKQYEVAISPEHLNATNITPDEVYTALENNNSIAGGSYLEKNGKSYFIRGEGLVSSISDIENIVVKNRNGFPVLVKDVAKVQLGHAPRFGAVTANGTGEKVFGQIMMLKNANSNQTINKVKQRIEKIQKTLPEGVYIKPILDRSELIGRTTATIAENLILGCLIVIFVVVLLLGNIRSGLIVASVIPLCLLFAISLMYLFGVDANLMSLGAIDFGIIIDGAVIIVEYIAYQFTRKHENFGNLSSSEKKAEKDSIALYGADRMMKSAIFGQVIILIVFIPIFSLQGVEGKMFIPMALTFSFALIGAMLFCLTYVPVVSSLFLKPSSPTKRNISVRLMNFLHKIYLPVIVKCMEYKKTVLSFSVVLVLIGGYIFSTMGSEFVPTLDEGDFVIQPVLPTGTSLKQTTEITTKIENILLENFPEVEQIVSRIGAAEVPTDPMSMEDSDIIIKLRPKDEWTSASSKDELADKFKEKLEIIPNLEVEFTQPIEMRFNELVTGVKSDIAVKIFGEDLSVLANKANEIKELIKNVEGASDISVEKVEGLPQMKVSYNRAKLARYGVSVEEVNHLISMNFAGTKAGNVFEGEKRFDLVVRLDTNYKKGINSLERLYVTTPLGVQVPLEELAEIVYTKGPAQISRDDTNRRIVVGINVRNRDLQSVVDDIERIIDAKLKLPTGYVIKYGGQFENLQSARNRLLIAVPIALALIFVMLYFAFSSLKETLIVFSAIPLASVGGILFLWLRGLPFSISAGVGFIALFGIVVLNGIVLIEHFKDKLAKDHASVTETLITAANERLRPVLITASAAALGFLPMAISTNAGAEVQRPLATVVIGGLITATLLTLIVLPVLYKMFNQKIKVKPNATIIIILISFISLSSNRVFAQTIELSTKEVLDSVRVNNLELKAASEQVNAVDAAMGMAFDFDKTNIYYEYDENNLATNNLPLKVFGIQQNFNFPTVYGAKHRMLKQAYEVEKSKKELLQKQLIKKVLLQLNNVRYTSEKQRIYTFLDSLYSNFSHAASRRFELGETNYLEKITAQTKSKEIAIAVASANSEKKNAYNILYENVQNRYVFTLKDDTLSKLLLKEVSLENNELISLFENQKKLMDYEYKNERQNLLPDITLGYFFGTNSNLQTTPSGYHIGLDIPILFGGKNSKIKAAKYRSNAAAYQLASYSSQVETHKHILLNNLEKQQLELNYYEKEGNALTEEIIKTADMSFKNGEIDFFQYIQSIETAMKTKLNYLKALYEYNNIVIEFNYLTL
ncbi:CusA/CzcA family heavy metal efflux RND transporter [Neptunitalea lumnitzerae]|uniref:Acriflavine resistance protein B n=1 Tax=Neptunitalea lumnitzerae TaxID=2965509 RepID=A0ABQ5MJD8_9FLAO|nr:CusA/CzcA family heavy metal efflux RND transporter [Neptunitalea sp. Y10]GLB49509.1 acriflavine resistance protein B [Neptunitalea sp. Y10]